MTPNGATPDPLVARLTAPQPQLDPRRYIARPDLVDIALAGTVGAGRFVAPVAMRCCRPRQAMHAAGTPGAVAVSELLFGEPFDLFDTVGDWAFGRSAHDHYTGWVPMTALADPLPDLPAVSITVRVAPVFAEPDIKAPVLAELPFAAHVTGTGGDRFFALAGGGFVHHRHLAPLPDASPLAVARGFAGAPYLWGGRSPLGVDCSGLVQVALAAAGIAAPRDTDQQLAEVGTAVAFEDRAGGDLVYFPGHVGILASRDRLVHANAHWMATVEEPLADVIARLAALGVAEPVSGVRRP